MRLLHDIRVSPTLADAYCSRAMFDFIDGPGTYHLSGGEVQALLDDAKHQIEEVWPEGCMPLGECNAYRGVLRQCRAALEEN